MKLLTIIFVTLFSITALAQKSDTVKLTPKALEQIKSFEEESNKLQEAQRDLAKRSQLFLETYLDARGKSLTASDSLAVIPGAFVIHKRKKK